ncbi:methylmalonyl-CoA mutase subunit beta [Microvirga sp. ACRRW]|uniref:methylmalonyl-CoA mutase family protein n=1 Tax=Microvirga sp. ACRRW TaxID=2918205 RepID=UPI001EF4D922|nr:methylmalonyl-CoA mutase family protein [Microvirga sp. ACRRW]MCG7392510.1 methylmalonyl-CoA mutase subunit beta [Microvirga sp. ACRRW]
MDDLSLAADFPQATREQWLKLVEGVLKGADFSKKLVGRSQDGIEIQPVYPKAEGAARIAREEAGRWRVSQRVDHPDAAKASELALMDLEGGADALTLVTRKAPSARGFGIKADSVEDLDKALSGVMLDLIHLRLDAGGKGRVMAEHLIELAERRGHKLSELSLDLGMDPIGGLASLGGLSVEWSEVSARMGAMLTSLTEKGFNGRAFIADGRAYHEAGASEAQELAAVLATGLSYLRALEAQGHSLDAVRHALSFLLVADADEFLTVAKFRALRRLWAQVEQACGLAPKPIRLHAETAWRMTTKRDPWVNMLRTTVATFSAGIGGADAITVLPFTAALGLPDAFARRVARNTQLILLEESNLWRVADPAAGAGGFEALTDALCEKAWSLLQEIEREGGIIESLKAGTLQSRIATTRAQREKAVATRKEPITGTSEFPNIHETDVAVLMPPAHNAKEASASSAVTVEPLPSIRTSEAFERLRDLSDAYLAKTDARPKVFLANLGPVSAFTARATFAKNFFEAGGIEAVMNDGFSDSEKLKHAFIESKTKLSCICSSDEIYGTHAEDAAKTLHEAGSSPIYLAGRPGDREEVLSRAGITTFIYAGCDTLKVLSEALDKACA